MPTLRYTPRRPHYRLQLGKRTLEAGQLFDASPEDARRLVLNDDIEAVPEPRTDTPHSPESGKAKKPTDSED